MARIREEDLFKSSTMTFGEHLDELRRALFKAMLALVVGFGIGLWMADWVVQRIQDPLRSALEDYYRNKAVKRMRLRLEERASAGDTTAKKLLEGNLEDSPGLKDGLLFEELYVQPEEILRELKRLYPGLFGKLNLPPPKAGTPPRRAQMLRLLIWRAGEDDDRLKMKSLSMQEPFMTWVKAALVAGFVLSCPFSLYFLWSFVAAGLFPHEKRYVHIFLPFSVALFLAGAALAFLFVFKPVLAFFLSFNDWLGIESDPRISEWLSFVLLLPVAFGVSFQLPLVMLFLERIGIFSAQVYLQKWRVAVLVIAVASMVLSPGGDPYSMMMMMVPLVGLYFGGVLLCKWMPAVRKKDQYY